MRFKESNKSLLQKSFRPEMCSLNFPISWKSGAGRGGGNRGTRTLCVQVRFPFAGERRNEGYCSNQLEKTVQRHGLGVLPR